MLLPAFQLQPWLMTPFRENQQYLGPDPAVNERKKRRYNRVLSSTREVEHTFGILKARFRRLTYVESKSVEKTVQIVVACCVLHNISLQRGDEWEYVEDAEGEAGPAVLEGREGRDQLRENAAAVARRAALVKEVWHARR